MKKGTIFKNTFCEYERYFMYLGPVHTSKYEKKAVFGYELIKFNNSDLWELKNAKYYIDTLKDEELFPVIGHLDINNLIQSAMLQKIKKYNVSKGGK